MLVANKVDCKGQRQVSEEEGHAFAKEHGLLFIETSAKTELGISQAFEELCQKIMDTDGLLVNDTTANTGIGGRGGGEHEVNSCGCT
jgi:Ras-related protein Rab-18